MSHGGKDSLRIQSLGLLFIAEHLQRGQGQDYTQAMSMCVRVEGIGNSEALCQSQFGGIGIFSF